MTGWTSTLPMAGARAGFPDAPAGRTGWPWTHLPAQTMEQAPDWPRITLVTPSLNQGEFIEETLRSVLLQGYPNLEYLVMDGGSRDLTPEILDRYRPWLSACVSEPDKGQADAINKGLRRGTGSIQGYLNSDDLLLPGALFRVASVFLRARHPGRLVASFTGEVREGQAQPVMSPPVAHPRAGIWLSSRESLFQPATFWGADLYTRLDGFDPGLNFCFDKDFFFRGLFIEGHYQAVSGPAVARLRMHAATKTSRLDDQCERENALIRARYGVRPAIRRRIRREERACRGRAALACAWQSTTARKMFAALVQAGFLAPDLWRDRAYWGAWRQCLTGSCRRDSRS